MNFKTQVVYFYLLDGRYELTNDGLTRLVSAGKRLVSTSKNYQVWQIYGLQQNIPQSYENKHYFLS